MARKINVLINKILDILIDVGQRDSRFGWGDIIEYEPYKVREILEHHTDELSEVLTGSPNIDLDDELLWFKRWGLTPDSADQVLSNYSAFLSSMTGGKLSRIDCDLKTMESYARDYWTNND